MIKRLIICTVLLIGLGCEPKPIPSPPPVENGTQAIQCSCDCEVANDSCACDCSCTKNGNEIAALSACSVDIPALPCNKEGERCKPDSCCEGLECSPDDKMCHPVAPPPPPPCKTEGEKLDLNDALKRLKKEGFSRVKIDGKVHDLEDEIKIDKKKKHDIDLFVDRLVLKPDIEGRLADSIETALRFSDGLLKVEILLVVQRGRKFKKVFLKGV